MRFLAADLPRAVCCRQVTKNFAFVLCVWDHLFGTFEPVVEPPDLPRWLRAGAQQEMMSGSRFATLAEGKKLS